MLCNFPVSLRQGVVLNHKSSPSPLNANLVESTELNDIFISLKVLLLIVVLGLNAVSHPFLCTLEEKLQVVGLMLQNNKHK